MRSIIMMIILLATKSCDLQRVNLAFRRPTYQTAPYKEKVSDLAVDGNLKTCAVMIVYPIYNQRAFASWNVQLDNMYHIESIIIAYDIKLPLIEYLNNFIIYVSIDASKYKKCVTFSNITAIYRNKFLNLSCEIFTYGNMVHIVKNRIGLDTLLFCEVFIYGKLIRGTITLPYMRPTDQSGVVFRDLSPLAVDGKLETCTKIISTKNQKAWWRVILDDIYVISNISIYFIPNDKGVLYLNNFHVYLSNDKNDYEQQLCNSFDGDVISMADRFINLTCVRRVAGKYVTIKKSGGPRPEWLYFCEIFIYPKENEGATTAKSRYYATWLICHISSVQTGGIECIGGSMTCESDLRCITNERICDRVKDCNDGSDELGCECFPYQYKCDSGLCIPNDWLCDGTKDCPNGDDEELQSCWCSDKKFKCFNHPKCIFILRVCDGISHCDDSSDEMHCLKLEENSGTSSIVKAIYRGTEDFYICSTHWNELISLRACIHMGRGILGTSKYVAVDTKNILDVVQKNVSLNEDIPIMQSFERSFFCETGLFVSLECSPITSEGCGNRLTDEANLPYIINGDVAYLGAWPWHTQLITDGFTFCGGSIIERNWILTAAHCVENIHNISTLTIKIGTIIQDDPRAERYYASRLVLHPSFSKTKRDDDVALIKTDRVLPKGFLTFPICLHDKVYNDVKLRRYRYCVVTGFGRNNRDDNRKPPVKLLQGRQNLMTNEECLKNMLNDTIHNEKYINRKLNTRKIICSGSTPTTYGVNVCNGDSGGPLVCRNENGIWTQIGIAKTVYSSKSDKICTNNVLVRVDYYLDFIRNIIYNF